MPSLGADMDAGTLVEWLVKPGDEVTRGQIVAVVETQKGAIDVEIFDDGEIVELLVQPIREVPVGTVLAIVRRPGEVVVERSRAAPVEPSLAPVEPSVASVEPSVGSSAVPASVPAPLPTSTARRVSPRARKLAAELAVDLARLVGSGPEGSIVGADVERAATPMQAPAPTPARRGQADPSAMRSAIAAAMSRSKRDIPHYYLLHTIDLEPALAWLERQNEQRPISARLLPALLFVRAVALALREFPQLCGFWRDDAFVPSPGIHVGVAVSLRGGGLVNPALHDADQGELDALMVRLRELGTRARSGGLRASELSDAAITLTSLGEQGVDAVLGVIQPPQVAIVGVGTIRLRPWVVAGNVVPRRIVELGLSADHRVSDGHTGARFLRKIEQLLTQPETLS